MFGLEIGTLGAVVLAIHALAVAVVNLTGTPDPDTLWGKAYRGIEFMAGIFRAAKVKK